MFSGMGYAAAEIFEIKFGVTLNALIDVQK
jgi:hypothetical protein